MERPFVGVVAAVLVVVVVFAGACASGADASQAVPFATVDGSCPSGGEDQFFAAPVTTSHPNVVARYSMTSGEAYLDDSEPLTAGVVEWEPRPALNVNDTPTVTDWACPSDTATFQTTFYDTPTAPTTYSGAGDSDLPFITAGTAQYVADLQLSAGSVDLGGGVGDVRYASSGQYPMGTLYGAGIHHLDVSALDGPTPPWTITIRPLPVAVSGLSFTIRITRPGPVVEADYTTSGDTRVTAVVRDAAGTAVRTLASALSVSEGDHSLFWDGRAANGASVPDGGYTLALTSVDPMGLTSNASTPITVDGTPPNIARTSPSVLGPEDPVVIQAVDALSGLADLQLADPTDPSYPLAETEDGPSVSYLPYDGWSLGAHTIHATATDQLGNVRAVNLSFTVSKPHEGGSAPTKKRPSRPRCTRAAAKRALAHNAAFMRGLRHLGLVHKYQSPFARTRYSLGKPLCRDLTGDRHKDMVAELYPPTTAATPLAVLKNTAHGWRLGFKLINRQVYSLRVRGRRVYWTEPNYRRNDALCCASGKPRHYVLSYRRGDFHLARQR